MGLTPTSDGLYTPGTGLWPTYRHLAMAHLPTLHGPCTPKGIGLGTGPTAIGPLHNYTLYALHMGHLPAQDKTHLLYRHGVMVYLQTLGLSNLEVMCHKALSH
jgi:hypothetical protein